MSRTESAIIWRFSSGDTDSTAFTWYSLLLPTNVTTGVWASSNRAA